MRQQKWWRRWFSRTAQIEVTVETKRTLVITHSEINSTSDPQRSAKPADLRPTSASLAQATMPLLTDAQHAASSEGDSRGN